MIIMAILMMILPIVIFGMIELNAAENVKVISTSLREAVGKIVLTAGGESEKAFKNVAEEVNNFVNAFIEIGQRTREVSEGNKEILNAVASLMQISQEI